MEKKYKRNRFHWDRLAEETLIDLWADHLGELRTNQKKSHIIEKMASEMCDHGIKVSAEEVRTKMHNLSVKYNRLRKMKGVASERRHQWELYARLKELMGQSIILQRVVSYSPSPEPESQNTDPADPLVSHYPSCSSQSVESFDFSISNMSRSASPCVTRSSSMKWKTPDPEEMSSKRYKSNRRRWTFEAEELLIDLWGDYITELRSTKKNGPVIEKMVAVMYDHGIKVSAEEIRTKMHNLQGKYKKERQLVVSGGSPSRWELYNELDHMLGEYTSSNSTMIDSIDIETLDNSSRPESPMTPKHPKRERQTSPCSSRVSFEENEVSSPLPATPTKRVKLENESLLERLVNSVEEIKNSELRKEKMLETFMKKCMDYMDHMMARDDETS